MIPSPSSQDEVRHSATIVNSLGLHARAAAKFAKLAGSFEADIYVSREGMRVSALSIMGLMMLAASQGCDIEMDAHGPEAETAVEALSQLIARRFDEG